MVSNFQKIGFFDHVDDVIDSMQRGQFSPAAYPVPNYGEVEAYVVYQQNPFSSVVAAHAVGDVVSMGFFAQMSEEDRTRVPEDFFFAAGDVLGSPHYVFKWPEDRVLDFEQLRDSADHIKILLKQRDYEPFEQIPDHSSYICLGPFSPDEEKLVTNAIARILSYQTDNLTPVFPAFETVALLMPEGKFWGMKREVYLDLFKDERRYSPLIGGDSKPLPPPPPAGCD